MRLEAQFYSFVPAEEAAAFISRTDSVSFSKFSTPFYSEFLTAKYLWFDSIDLLTAEPINHGTLVVHVLNGCFTIRQKRLWCARVVSDTIAKRTEQGPRHSRSVPLFLGWNKNNPPTYLFVLFFNLKFD